MFSESESLNCNGAWYPFLPLGLIEDWDIIKVDSTCQGVSRQLNQCIAKVVSGSRIPLESLEKTEPAFLSAATCFLSYDFAQCTLGQAWAEYYHWILLSSGKWNCPFGLKGVGESVLLWWKWNMAKWIIYGIHQRQETLENTVWSQKHNHYTHVVGT